MPTDAPSLPHIRVVAAVIAREGRYLITQRRSTAVLPGLWEFPGGRVEAGENDQTALAREVRERLSIDAEIGAVIGNNAHEYDGYVVDLVLYQATLKAGQEPKPARVAQYKWVASDEFDAYPFPAADQATMDMLLGIKRLK